MKDDTIAARTTVMNKGSMTTNHPAHGPVSLKCLHQIREILSKASAQSDGGNLGYAMADAVKVIDGAIAAFGTEPVAVNDDMAYAFHHALSDSSLGADEVEEIKTGLRAAFANVTAQSAPVVPDEYRHLSELYHAQEKRLFKLAQRIKGPSFDKYAHSPSQAIDVLESAIFGDNKDACRAARLQAEPVSNHDELPLDYLQGHKDGLEWAAQLAEANHPQTGDWLYDDPIELARAIRKGPDMPEFKSVSVDEDDNFYSWFGRFWYENYQKNNYTTSAKQMLGTMAEFAYRAGRESAALAGNSPVTPDGWIPVSERKPNDKDFVWCWGYVSGWTESDGFEAYYDATRNKWWTVDDETVRKITHWMPLPAAPQQEVKSE
ncbi:DUF551 domain-containing protein [Citrobacter sp. Ce104]|uniref:DUF551 domain-containing protein n=1 Tax=Citrobacter sp. Ce104 TaxID=2985040 RepID=UPI0025766DE9|nr:DUF551 domain-containing protein [Citrobacter sp. Ce104]MDM3281796.1 DUF551 domain-containing protein [Citrobacter sp. Ce104]